MSAQREHWQQVYQQKAEQQTSWFQPHLEESLRLIDGLDLACDAPVIDIGAGRSTLVDDLLERGFRELTVLDISTTALQESQRRLGTLADAIQWHAGDLFDAQLPADGFGLWHDRAVFHFLIDANKQSSYVALASRSIRAGGFLIVATFAMDGPQRCSGLPVCRYDANTLAARFAPDFTPVAVSAEAHVTPFSTRQEFTYVVLRRLAKQDHAAPAHPLETPTRDLDPD